MRTLELHNKHFICEVCDESTADPTTTGIESHRDITRSIQLCHGCGLIDLDLMQFCREITIGCNDN